jgi:8-oxo-dGTP pyrophosphatase MutT (NUDIX family)
VTTDFASLVSQANGLLALADAEALLKAWEDVPRDEHGRWTGVHPEGWGPGKKAAWTKHLAANPHLKPDAPIQAKSAAAPAGKPDLSELKFAGSGTKLGGAHDKYLFTDKQGNQWLFKPATNLSGQKSEIMAHADEMASKVAMAVRPDSAVEAHAVSMTIPGKGEVLGSVQRVEQSLGNPKDFSGRNPATLKDWEVKGLQQEHVTDWLISNHDAHGGQFLRTADDRVVGIDKTQAFKYFGKDKLDVNYHPNAVYGEHPPYYNDLYKAVAAGKVPSFDPKNTLPAIERAQKISDSDYRKMLEPYAAARQKSFGADKESFLKAAVERKNNLRTDFEKFYSGILGKPVSLAKSAGELLTAAHALLTLAEAHDLLKTWEDVPRDEKGQWAGGGAGKEPPAGMAHEYVGSGPGSGFMTGEKFTWDPGGGKYLNNVTGDEHHPEELHYAIKTGTLIPAGTAPPATGTLKPAAPPAATPASEKETKGPIDFGETFGKEVSRDEEHAAQEKGDQLFAEWRGNLSKDELDAIESYRGEGYTAINAMLRGRSIPDFARSEAVQEKYAKQTELIDSALAKASTPRDMVVYRGFNGGRTEKRVSQLEPGEKFSDKGYTSTSLARYTPVDVFSGGGLSHDDYRSLLMARITIPAGSHAAYVSEPRHGYEAEVLIGRGASYKVTSTERVKLNYGDQQLDVRFVNMTLQGTGMVKLAKAGDDKGKVPEVPPNKWVWDADDLVFEDDEKKKAGKKKKAEKDAGDERSAAQLIAEANELLKDGISTATGLAAYDLEGQHGCPGCGDKDYQGGKCKVCGYEPVAKADVPHGWAAPTDSDWMKRSYGGIVVNDKGEFLLCKPTDGNDGMQWTWPKGGLNSPDEAPEDAALREVREESGYPCEITGYLPGSFTQGWSTTNLYLMRPTGPAGARDGEMSAVEWAPYLKAKQMLGQSDNVIERQRDLLILQGAAKSLGLDRSLDAMLVQIETKVRKDGAGYVYKPEAEGRYQCEQCPQFIPFRSGNIVTDQHLDRMFGIDGWGHCVFFTANDVIKAWGTCTYWMLGTPDPNQAPQGYLTKEEAGYAENKDGFGCKRCVYFDAPGENCHVIDKDSAGDTPGKIIANACCGNWENNALLMGWAEEQIRNAAAEVKKRSPWYDVIGLIESLAKGEGWQDVPRDDKGQWTLGGGGAEKPAHWHTLSPGQKAAWTKANVKAGPKPAVAAGPGKPANWHQMSAGQKAAWTKAANIKAQAAQAAAAQTVIASAKPAAPAAPTSSEHPPEGMAHEYEGTSSLTSDAKYTWDPKTGDYVDNVYGGHASVKEMQLDIKAGQFAPTSPVIAGPPAGMAHEYVETTKLPSGALPKDPAKFTWDPEQKAYVNQWGGKFTPGEVKGSTLQPVEAGGKSPPSGMAHQYEGPGGKYTFDPASGKYVGVAGAKYNPEQLTHGIGTGTIKPVGGAKVEGSKLPAGMPSSFTSPQSGKPYTWNEQEGKYQNPQGKFFSAEEVKTWQGIPGLSAKVGAAAPSPTAAPSPSGFKVAVGTDYRTSEMGRWANAREATTESAASTLGSDANKGGWGKLNAEEKHAVDYWSATGYGKINQQLRANSHIDSDTITKVALLDSSLGKNSVPMDMVVYRGFQGATQRLFDLTPGKGLVDNGFVATSTLKESSFGGHNNLGEEVKARILIPKGTRAAYIKDWEHELLLARGSILDFVGRETRVNAIGKKEHIVTVRVKQPHYGLL